MGIARFCWLAFVALLIAAAGQWLFVRTWPEPQDLPWTPLDLRAPVGRFTGAKLAMLARRPHLCRMLLGRADVAFVALPARVDGARCGWSDAVRLTGPARPHLPLSCPLAAGFDLWMRRVVQPAAADLLGARVVRVEDLGSYACRRIAGAAEGGWSEHARANAVDISGFRLADGGRVTIARDWRAGRRGRFLHRIRDGGCRLFATTLSPDYNAAHRDHLHLDMAWRGGFGGGACR